MGWSMTRHDFWFLVRCFYRFETKWMKERSNNFRQNRAGDSFEHFWLLLMVSDLAIHGQFDNAPCLVNYLSKFAINKQNEKKGNTTQTGNYTLKNSTKTRKNAWSNENDTLTQVTLYFLLITATTQRYLYLSKYPI